MKRGLIFLGLSLLVLVAGGCSSSTERPKKYAHSSCLGLQDDLKTLKVGDELPRVVQVLGMPNAAYRAYSPFGRSYDVLEYEVAASPCMRAVLHITDKLQVLFDGNGQYVGHGDEAYMRFRRATTLRVERLVIDPIVLRP